jgi:hypothetical protein
MNLVHKKIFSANRFHSLKYCICFFLFAALLFCDNPFFPKTGIPPVTSAMRSTPQGVIRQLINAYEARRIDLYTDLFSTAHDFRFYVSPAFAVDGYTARFGARPCEEVDSMCRYVKNNINDECFYYWTYAEEIMGAQNLFQKATDISFVSTPTYADEIRYITDDNNDTVNVEVVMRGGTIDIQGGVYIDSANQRCVDEYPVDIYEQVFYLERDPQDNSLWVIKKWFDLGTSTGN